MSTEKTTCRFCAEEIKPEAIRCPHCRSRLTSAAPLTWHRGHDDKKVAGVSAAVARAFALPIGGVRLAFVILTFVHFIGPIVYGALWLLIPAAEGKPSVLETVLYRAHQAVRTEGCDRCGTSGGASVGSEPVVNGGHDER